MAGTDDGLDIVTSDRITAENESHSDMVNSFSKMIDKWKMRRNIHHGGLFKVSPYLFMQSLYYSNIF